MLRKKKQEGFVVPYGTDLLLEPYGFATIQIFYNVTHKNQLPYGGGLLILLYGIYPFILPGFATAGVRSRLGHGRIHALRHGTGGGYH
jgi:hypothetical protein